MSSSWVFFCNKLDEIRRHALSKQIFGPADLRVKTERVELCALMLGLCVKGSQVKTFPTCLFLKPPLFTYIVLKKFIV